MVDYSRAGRAGSAGSAGRNLNVCGSLWLHYGSKTLLWQCYGSKTPTMVVLWYSCGSAVVVAAESW